MCNVYVNGSPPFKKKTPNNSHMNVSFLTLIINIFFFKFWFITEHFSQQTRIPKSILWDGGWRYASGFQQDPPVGALQNKSNYMKIALRLLYRLRWIFNVHGEYPFSPESCYIKDNQEKRVCFFWTYMPMKKISSPPHYYSKITVYYYTSSTFSLAEGLLSASLSYRRKEQSKPYGLA